MKSIAPIVAVISYSLDIKVIMARKVKISEARLLEK